MQRDDRPTLDVEVGKYFRELRLQKGLTQANVAARLETSGLSLDPTAITRIEKGTRALRLSEASAIAAALETTLEGVLTDVGSPEDRTREEIRDAISQVTFVRSVVARWLEAVARSIRNGREFADVIPGVPPELLGGWMDAQMEDRLVNQPGSRTHAYAPDDGEGLWQLQHMLELVIADIVVPPTETTDDAE